MNPDLERDFVNQRANLTLLRDQRNSCRDGSETAEQVDRSILAAENLIQSYEALKYYESPRQNLDNS